MDGMLLVNKPPGMTSHDVVQAARRRLGQRRIGHTGTLDPMAQGLLILLVGSATKRQQAFQRHEKSYEACVQLGRQTDTGDAEGRVIRTAEVPALARAHVETVLATLTGPMTQTPPVYSAVKVRGRPSYWWARKQQSVSLRSRTIHISAVSLCDLTADTLTVRVDCSAGTYVRTIAEVLAERLGTVGHVAALTRLRIGAWVLDEAIALAELTEAPTDRLAEFLRPAVEPYGPREMPRRGISGTQSLGNRGAISPGQARGDGDQVSQGANTPSPRR